MGEERICRAGMDDRAVIVEFNQAMALETEGRRLDLQRLTQGVEAVLSDPAKGFYLLVERDGQVIGQTLITLEWSDWRNGDFWWIQSVYVRPEYRRQGVYTRLYDHVKKEARARPDVCGLRLYVAKGNTRAKSVYRACGMHEADYELFEKDFVMAESE